MKKKNKKYIWIVGVVLIVALVSIIIFNNFNNGYSVLGDTIQRTIKKPLTVATGCVPMTCQDIFSKQYPGLAHCGKYDNGCGTELNCGTCSGLGLNHVYILGCADTVATGEYAPWYGGHCDNYTINSRASVVIPQLQSNEDAIVNYFGGYSYLYSLNRPFPDAKVTFEGDAWHDVTSYPDGITLGWQDGTGQQHELIHWLIRGYSHVDSSFYFSFEEGFTNMISGYQTLYGTNDPCWDLTKGTCSWSDTVNCIPGSPCNYQSMQSSLVTRTTAYLGCDLDHCWRWFFKNKIATKDGVDLTIQDVYDYLVSYTQNKDLVDSTLDSFLSYQGVTIPTHANTYTIPNEAYPSLAIKDSILNKCRPNYQCSSWSTCSGNGGTESRTCTDLNHCTESYLLPPITRACPPSQTPDCLFMTSVPLVNGGYDYLGIGHGNWIAFDSNNDGIKDVYGQYGSNSYDVCKNDLGSTQNFPITTVGNVKIKIVDSDTVDICIGDTNPIYTYIYKKSYAPSHPDLTCESSQCTPNWQTSSWSTCSGGTQTRTVNDANECNDNSNKPATSQSCTSCTPNWNCGDWNTCSNNQQTRTCTDSNGCNINTNKPSTSQACTITCTPNFQCGNWSTCNSGNQIRTCSDLNGCIIASNFENQSCTSTCTPNWQCNSWSTCSNSQQTRTCNDLNSCGTSNPNSTSQSCSTPAPNYWIYIIIGIIIAIVVIIILIKFRKKVAKSVGLNL